MNKIKEIPLIKIHKEVLTEVGLYWTIQETVGELLSKQKEDILGLESMKEEKIDIHIFDGRNDIVMCRNQLRTEIKEEIKKIQTTDFVSKSKKMDTKDKLGDSFTKFLESEGYEVIDCTIKK